MKNTYIYSVSSLLQIDTPYLCHIDLKISSLTAVTYCRLELQSVVTKIPKCVSDPSIIFLIMLFPEYQYEPGKFVVSSNMKRDFDEDGFVIVRY